ncbi:hypothetical protein IE53DRAFT_98324 [Violaceomyces palustris]|uniref:Uncharacterized protein n=1 Tax=Violaceomyces palustris TaxID=1673888 RepID=A0ACD0NX24_9BASI|nr:hypothetical protein IE53DRAFT_98324 [Violaceomyces palustris]
MGGRKPTADERFAQPTDRCTACPMPFHHSAYAPSDPFPSPLLVSFPPSFSFVPLLLTSSAAAVSREGEERHCMYWSIQNVVGMFELLTARGKVFFLLLLLAPATRSGSKRTEECGSSLPLQPDSPTGQTIAGEGVISEPVRHKEERPFQRKVTEPQMDPDHLPTSPPLFLFSLFVSILFRFQPLSF